MRDYEVTRIEWETEQYPLDKPIQFPEDASRSDYERVVERNRREREQHLIKPRMSRMAIHIDVIANVDHSLIKVIGESLVGRTIEDWATLRGLKFESYKTFKMDYLEDRLNRETQDADSTN